MFCPPSVAQNLRKLPGRSGMVTARTASRCSPTSASSAMKRRRSKLVLAPDAIAIRVLFLKECFSTQAFAPAVASAPAGSSTTRVSSNTSLIAAHIASVSTSTISSTSRRQRRNVSLPTSLTATPGKKADVLELDAPLFLQGLGHRVRVDRLYADDANAGIDLLEVGRDARDQAAAAHRHEHRVDRLRMLAQDLHADRAL